MDGMAFCICPTSIYALVKSVVGINISPNVFDKLRLYGINADVFMTEQLVELSSLTYQFIIRQ